MGLIVAVCCLVSLDGVNGALASNLGQYLGGSFAATPDQITWAAIFYFAPKLHMLLLAASHAARDLFAPHAVKSLLDAALLLRRHQSAFDWDRLTALARAGRSLRPLSVTLALLSALGLPLPTVPETLCRRPRGLAGVEFGRLAASLQALPAAAEATPLQRLRLEWLLAAGPGVSLQRNLRRLRGLVRANPGLPATRANG